jgi:AAA domain-containing protein
MPSQNSALVGGSAHLRFHVDPTVHTATTLLKNPELLKPPAAIVQRFLYRQNLTLLAAREKDGKSTLATAIAASVSSGKRFLGELVVRGPVLWLRLEEPTGTLLRRLVDFGADTDNIYIPDRLPNGPHDLPAMVTSIKPVVVVIDTLAALACDVVSDPYNSLQWTRVMRPIAELAQTHDAGMLLLHHARRSDGKYRDSTAIGANVDHILEMEADSSDPSVRAFKPKGRWPIQPFRIQLHEGAYRLADADAGLEAKIIAHIEAVPGGSLRALREAVGGKGTKADDVLARLISEGRVVDLGNASGKALWLPEACSEPGTRSEGDTLAGNDGGGDLTDLTAMA